MNYGYARVSTQCQARDGNSLEAQKTALTAAGATEIFSDAFTGTKTDRPELNKLLEKIAPGDTLIFTKLDPDFYQAGSCCQKSHPGNRINRKTCRKAD